jgi:polyisoprenyl-phosphate glycosyltransferase
MTRSIQRDPRRLCLVIPVHNEAENLPLMADRLIKVAATLEGWTTQTLFVDDGSSDASVQVLDQLRAAGVPVGYARLSRNCGHQAALCAGFEVGDADAYITLDCDLQHPPEEIPRMVEQFDNGFDVVQMVRNDSTAGGKGLFSRAFYAAFNHLSDTQLIPNAADFRLLSRRVRDALVRIPEREKFLRGLIPSLGFKQVSLHYDECQRQHGKPTYTFRSSLRLARKALFDYSTVPLKGVFWLGMIMSIFSFVFGLGHVIEKLIYRDAITPGFTDIITAIFLLGGCILASVGTVGRYMIMILEQVRGRPTFVVMDNIPGGPMESAAPASPPQIAAEAGNAAAPTASTVSSGKPAAPILPARRTA